MKTKTVLLFSVSILLLVFFSSFSGLGVFYPSGAPAGYTGSPADGKNCTHCHGGTPQQLTNIITSTIPETGYIPGDTYEITATLSGSGKKGFEISPQNFGGDILGTLAPGSGSKLTGNGAYITHSTTNHNNPAVWVFNWTAPPEGTGDVVFYGAFAVTDNHTKLSTLLVHEDITAGINQVTLTHFVVGPNPFHQDLQVSYSLSAQQPVEISVYSLSGRKVVLHPTTIEQPGEHHLNINLPGDFPTGVVLLQINTGNRKIVKKLIYN